jgi:hypothetical protein
MKYLTGRTSFNGVKGGVGNFSFQKNLYVFYKKNLGNAFDVAKFVIRNFIFFRGIKIRRITRKLYY